jgi:hypothetical protein
VKKNRRLAKTNAGKSLRPHFATTKFVPQTSTTAMTKRTWDSGTIECLHACCVLAMKIVPPSHSPTEWRESGGSHPGLRPECAPASHAVREFFSSERCRRGDTFALSSYSVPAAERG